MCSETVRDISAIDEAQIREVFEAAPTEEKATWTEVLTLAETSGFTPVLVLLAERVEGIELEGLTPSEFGLAFERELRILICTSDPKYKMVRDEIKKANQSVRVIGTGIATALAASWHLQAGLLTPFVLVFLMGLTRVTVEAWCAGKPIETVREMSPKTITKVP